MTSSIVRMDWSWVALTNKVQGGHSEQGVYMFQAQVITIKQAKSITETTYG